MKRPPTEALRLNQGMPAYSAKKIVYYQDKRFMYKAYSRKKIIKQRKEIEVTTGYPPPASRAELEKEVRGLPSVREKQKKRRQSTETSSSSEHPISQSTELEMAETFDPVEYLESYEDIMGWAAPSFQAPDQQEFVDSSADEDIPPTVVPLDYTDFMEAGCGK
jgi:hypothetical protein